MSDSGKTISSSFYHSTPRMTRRRKTVGYGPLRGEQFCCDANAWLDLEQMAAQLEKMDDCDCVAIANSAEDWWLVQLEDAEKQTQNAEQRCNNGRISTGSRISIGLTEWLSRWVTGTVIGGQRITSTEAKLLVLEKVDARKERVVTERGKVATERTFAKALRRRKEMLVVRINDSDCEADDDLCTCRKCREKPE